MSGRSAGDCKPDWLWARSPLEEMKYLLKKELNQLHAISRTQQGRQREPSVKTLRSPLSAVF